MSADGIASAREALMAQLLEDVDALLARLESVDERLREELEAAVMSAAGEAFLRARLELVQQVEAHERRLIAAAQEAAARLTSALDGRGVTLLAAAGELRRRALAMAMAVGALALLGGALGGVLGMALVSQGGHLLG